jgi:hypothetical protein
MTCAAQNPMPQAADFRRSAQEIMDLPRMGSAHPTRLSFLRVLLRRIQTQEWRFERAVWQVDATGVGHAVYSITSAKRSYSLVAFAHDLPDDMRSDRVIATAWDATFTLFDGIPTQSDLNRLAANVPLQEAGRITSSELTLSRANRSVRLFDHVVDRLATGAQPDLAEVASVGYLMRTTAVYGAGKFGAADRSVIAQRDELSGPFQAEMLTVWLIRQFTVDIVEHMAAMRGGVQAARLDPKIKQSLGVGNSTGLGMAPFLVRHPMLLNNWMMAREEALSRVRAQANTDHTRVQAFRAALDAAIENAQLWTSNHPIQIAKLADLRHDLDHLCQKLQTWPQGTYPWDALWRWAGACLSQEGQEALLALMLEPHGDLIDGLADCMTANEADGFFIDGSMTIGQTRQILADRYGWALQMDVTRPENNARFWYVSEEKLEPRLGFRHSEDGADREQPLCIAQLAHALHDCLLHHAADQPIAQVLLHHPEHRYMVRRVQIAARHPFAEVQANLIQDTMLPIDLMRCKLAFFGASRFDPRSDKWVRISLFQGETYPEDLAVAARGSSAQ